jgi:hypothetical protein
MSKEIWESQLEINKIFDKRAALTEAQLTALTDLVIEQGKLLALLSQPLEPSGCTGRHCACKAGEM